MNRTLAALVVLGVVVRLAFLTIDRPFWGDEAAVALNLQARSYSQLAKPLAEDQAAPYLFLVSERAILTSAGLNERALRLPAFISALLALAGLAFLAARLLSPTAALLAVALAAVAPGFVRYSAELKPYSSDVLATIVLATLAAWTIARKYSARSLLALTVAGAVAVWVSFPAVFVLAGVGATLLADRIVDRDLKRGVLVAGAALVWTISFAGVYWLAAGTAAESPYLRDFWQHAFAPLPPRSFWAARRIVEMFFAPIPELLGLGAVIGATFYLPGIIALWTRNWRLACGCIVPVAAVFVASAAELYPFAGRLVLFTVPLYLVPIAEGFALVVGSRRWIGLTVAAVMVCGPLITLNDLLDQPQQSGVRDVLPHIGGRALEGDAVYVYANAQRPFRVYLQSIGRVDLPVTFGQSEIWKPEKLRADLAQLSGHRRVWFLLSEVHRFFGDEEQLLIAEIEKYAERRDEVRMRLATAFLYESSSGEWTSPALRPERPPN